MEERFYSVENCKEFSADISAFTDTVKYLMNLPKSEEDSKLLTPELLEAFEGVAGACEELVASYKYYKEAKVSSKQPEAVEAFLSGVCGAVVCLLPQALFSAPVASGSP